MKTLILSIFLILIVGWIIFEFLRAPITHDDE